MKNLFKFYCEDKSLYKDSKFIQDLERLFEDAVVDKRAIGDVITTVINEQSIEQFYKINNFFKLYSWISKQILTVSDSLGFVESNNTVKVNIERIWANKMFKGSSGQCHIHQLKNKHSGIAVFYVDAPENSAKLVVIPNGKQETKIEEYKKEECEYIDVMSGNLIVHPSTLPHAVSTHNSDKPRICIVIEFYYELAP